MDDIVVIAGRILDERRGLSLADLVDGARRGDDLAGRLGSKAVRPGAESEISQILAERRFRPGLLPIGGDLTMFTP
jgi:hypothetical protein